MNFLNASLRGRGVLLTGGAGHLGRAFARSLAGQGADIVLLDLESELTTDLSRDITSTYGVRCFAITGDLGDDVFTHAAVHEAAKKLGRLDILINNAGFVGTSQLDGWVTDFEHQTTETWRKAFEVNITAPFTLCREASSYLAKSGHGSIINVGSIYAVCAPDMSLYAGTSMGNPAAYGAAKAGLLQFTRWLATALAPHVRVNSMCPGGVWRNQPEAFVERYEKRTPLGRMATEEDMCGTLLYLSSDMSKYVTGQNIMVDGGWGVW